jgi:hypothetical protein
MLPPHCNASDKPVDEEGPLSIGTRLGEFEIRSLIGIGRVGIVYRAFDHELEREVAVREYLPAALASRADDGRVHVREPALSQAFGIGLQRFLRQAQLLARFDHPALVEVFRYWEGNGTAYMVMPFYAGQTLAQTLRQLPAPPTEAWLMGVLVPLLGALDSLHSQQILHCRVVPDNIRLLRNGRPVLLEPASAPDSMQAGDSAIEQVIEGPELRQGPWTDLYALATVVHASLSGKPPLAAQARADQDELEPLADVAARLAVSHGLRYRPAFIGAWQQALSLRPVDRPQNVHALMQQLGLFAAPTLLAGSEWSEVPVAPADAATATGDALTPLEAPQRRSYGMLALVLAGLLGTGVVGYLVFRTAPGSGAPRLAPVGTPAVPVSPRPPPVIIDEAADKPVRSASAALPSVGIGRCSEGCVPRCAERFGCQPDAGAAADLDTRAALTGRRTGQCRHPSHSQYTRRRHPARRESHRRAATERRPNARCAVRLALFPGQGTLHPERL